MFIPDYIKLQQCPRHFEVWCGKLFYYHGDVLGWRYIKDLSAVKLIY